MLMVLGRFSEKSIGSTTSAINTKYYGWNCINEEGQRITCAHYSKCGKRATKKGKFITLFSMKNDVFITLIVFCDYHYYKIIINNEIIIFWNWFYIYYDHIIARIIYLIFNNKYSTRRKSSYHLIIDVVLISVRFVILLYNMIHLYCQKHKEPDTTAVPATSSASPSVSPSSKKSNVVDGALPSSSFSSPPPSSSSMYAGSPVFRKSKVNILSFRSPSSHMCLFICFNIHYRAGRPSVRPPPWRDKHQRRHHLAGRGGRSDDGSHRVHR